MHTYNIICQLLVLIDRASGLFYRQDYFNGINYGSRIIRLLSQLLTVPDSTEQRGTAPDGAGQAAVFCGRLTACLPLLLQYQETADYIGMADVYCMQIKPVCEAWRDSLRAAGTWQTVTDFYERNYSAADEKTRCMLDEICAQEEDIPENYQMIESAVGSFTLQIRQKNGALLLSSQNDPYEEAVQLADAYCKENVPQYALLGLGMGYLAQAVCERENVYQLRVFEHDPYVVKAAFHYADLTALLKTVQVVYDPMLKQFSEMIAAGKEDTGVIIHRPSMMNIANEMLRDKVQNFFLHDSSIKSQGKKLYGNFYRNTTHEALAGVCTLDTLKEKFCGRNMLLIAGGPSLEQDIAFLQECSEDYTVTTYSEEGVQQQLLSELLIEKNGHREAEEYIVVCVGTVLGRLLVSGICPDYVVMTDPQENMVSQTAGIDTSKLSLIYLPTLYYQVAENWKGAKYMGLQKGFELSERRAAEAGEMLYETGGSVATFAFDMGLRFGCKRIVCLGLDLAFVDNKRHAGEAAGIQKTGAEFKKVASVSGTSLLTSRNLDNYRLWLERRIAHRTAKEQRTELINASGGALIHGMQHKPLKEL